MNSRLLGSPLPIVAAPMAGGPSTVGLARAVSAAGAFPFLAGGYKTVEELAVQINQVREINTGFGVNLFVPSDNPVDVEAFEKYAAEVQFEAVPYEIEVTPHPATDDDHWKDKLALLMNHPVPVVSFTFGLPKPEVVSSLREQDSRVLATVTTVDEAHLAAQAGVDGLIVQGPAAGGHSAIFDANRTPSPISLTDLVGDVIRAVDLPVIAAGGIDSPTAVGSVLGAGAEAVAVGTLLLRTDEAGTNSTHREALADQRFTETVLTRAFTGRPARALRNGFTDRHPDAPCAYPAVHHLTRELRAAASSAGDVDRLHLWAGTGWRKAPTGPAADVIAHLATGI